MADLDELREELKTARTGAENARRAALAAQHHVDRLERDARALARVFVAGNPAHEARKRELTIAIRGARSRLAEATRKRVTDLAALRRAHGLVAEIADPRKTIARLSTNFPILLFPVRLETRFVRGGSGPAGKQLLVRIYPDDCSIDGFEPDLSEAEVKNLRRYWCGVWNAGGDLGLWRAAWRELASAHGAGR